MTPRSLGLLCLLGLLWVNPARCAQPNVILVMTDDQGYGDLSVHGNPVLRTPHLDQLHDQSIRLTDFHVAPMCTPTRGQLMTGLDAFRNGAMNVSSGRTLLRPELPTMADIFATNGYRTALFGKWHLGDNYPYRPQDRGFHKSIWLRSSHTPSASDYWNNDYFDDVYVHNGRLEPFDGYCTDVFFREAIQWMRLCASQGESFFCYIAPNAPHGPLFVPESYRAPYQSQSRAIASFLGMIANIDENMGRLDQFLQESGLAKDTLLIFMTDNGTATGESVFNAGMRGKKISLYDGGHRVPFFLRWPKGQLRPPGDVKALTQCQDVLPTLIDLCGLKPPIRARFDGQSLAPLLRGESPNLAARQLVVQFSRMQDSRPRFGDAAVLSTPWRLVGTNELYDIDQDPGQTNNVLLHHPEVAARLFGHYRQWWQTVEPRLHEFSPIHLGSPREPLTCLTPCEWQDVFLDQQAQVRRGENKNGPWRVLVETAGPYEVALRRWPFEADAAISAGLSRYQAVDGRYPIGQGLPITKARLQIGSLDLTTPVEAQDKAVVFRITLPAGPANLQTWFYDDQDKPLCGAYYVYVRSLAPPLTGKIN